MKDTERESIAANLKELTVWQLARLATVADPSTSTSHGAEFLTSVRDAVAESIVDGQLTPGEDWRDQDSAEATAHEIADNAPNVYTYPKWLQFADLAAWNEAPVGDSWPEDLTDAASSALFQIAERLVNALMDDAHERIQGDDDDQDEEHVSE